MLRATKAGGLWLPILLLESALIVGSILLAFGLSGWWETRQDQQLAERALVSFEQEIRQNHENLQAVWPYHVEIKEQFVGLREGGTVRTFADLDQLEGFEGFRPAFLTTTAWESAMATGALAHIDYDLVAALSNVYTGQERFTAMSDARFLLAPGAFAEHVIGATLLSIELYLSDVTYSGREMIRVYDQMIEVLENR